MKVRLRAKGQVRVFEEAELIIVEDSHGNPVMVGCLAGPADSFVCSTVSDPDFNSILRQLGINKTVLVTNVPTGGFGNHMPIQVG